MTTFARLDPRAAGVVVWATITGPGAGFRAKLAVDTGATFCLLPPKLAWAAGIVPTGGTPLSHISTPAGILNLPLVTLPRVKVGGARADHISCLLHELPPPSGVDGLLGLSFLRRFNVAIDFDRSKISFEPRVPRRPR